MSASGTPQSALYNKRPQGTDYARDRSMEQYYTPSGNPYGYIQGGNMYRTPVPSNVPYDGSGGYMPQGSNGGGYGGYTPPQISGGQWSAQGFAPRSGSYNLPSANGTGFGNGQYTPGYQPPPYMPNFQGYQQAYNNFNNGGMMMGNQGSQYQPQYNPQGMQQFQNQYNLAAQGMNNLGMQGANFNQQFNPQLAPNQNVSQMAAQIGGVQQQPAYQGLQQFANFQPQFGNSQRGNVMPRGNATANGLLGERFRPQFLTR